MADRDAAVVELYSTGRTLREVGTHFGIGPERVRQIVLKQRRARDRSDLAEQARAVGGARAVPIGCLGLSMRTVNALRNEGFMTLGDVADGLMFVQAAPNAIPNFGKKSLDEIRKALEQEGLLKSVPSVSKKGVSALASLGLRRTADITESFSPGGRFYNRASASWRLRDVDHKTLAELRSIAEQLKSETD